MRHALALLVTLVAASAIVYPQAVGVGVGPSFPQPALGGSSVYDDAMAVWTFDDPGDLGNDDTGNGNDLTEVNSPTPTGGALGYAADFESSSSQYASHNTGFDFTDEDFAVCAWARLESIDITAGIAAEDDGVNSNWGFYVNTDEDTVFYIQNGADATKSAAYTAGDWVAGERAFVCGYHNAAADEVYAWKNGSASSATATAGGIQTDAADSTIARQGAGNEWDGVLGPVWVWDGAYSTADFTTLYNSGKSYTCANTPTLVNAAEHCYEMDEDGGPYVDSVGSTNFTAVNAPTRKPGLVERSDSGMSLAPGTAGTGYLRDSTADRWDRTFSTDYSTSVWFNTPRATTEYQVWQDWNGNRVWGIETLLNGTARCGMMDSVPAVVFASTATDAVTSNQWHLGVCTYTGADHKVRFSLDGATFVVSAALSGDFYQGGDVTSMRLPSATTKPNAIDNGAIWYGKALSQEEATALWNAGAGDFYAAVWDVIFNGPRFAWSAKPEIRRIDG